MARSEAVSQGAEIFYDWCKFMKARIAEKDLRWDEPRLTLAISTKLRRLGRSGVIRFMPAVLSDWDRINPFN